MQYCQESRKVEAAALEWLKRRKVEIEDIARLVWLLQKDFYPDLTQDECRKNVERVLAKREVQNTILTGIQMDMLAEEKKLMSPLQEIVYQDEGLYGCDEVLALSIVNVYGSIGWTNFGYIDKMKPGILQRLNDKNDKEIHTFLDDIVGAIAAAACSRIAHRKQAQHEEEKKEI